MKKIKNIIWILLTKLINLLSKDNKYVIVTEESQNKPIPETLIDIMRRQSEVKVKKDVDASKEFDDKLTDFIKDKSDRITEINEIIGSREVESEDSIKEHMIKSAKLLNQYRDLRNKIIGFNSPSDELKGLLEVESYEDKKVFKKTEGFNYRENSEDYQKYFKEISKIKEEKFKEAE